MFRQFTSHVVLSHFQRLLDPQWLIKRGLAFYIDEGDNRDSEIWQRTRTDTVCVFLNENYSY